MIRIPTYKPFKSTSARIEFRAPDPACNPYLMFSVVLAAGLRGIEKGYELPPETEDNIFELTEAERRAAGIDRLPNNLDEALREMERSELVAETLGEHVFEFFLRNKRVEWDAYRAQVTPYEIERYLPML
jgi:glutamine synthetase